MSDDFDDEVEDADIGHLRPFGLNKSQLKFADELRAGTDPFDAYRIAGYRARSRKGASVQISRTRNNPKVIKYLAHCAREAAGALDGEIVDGDRAVRILSDLALTAPDNVRFNAAKELARIHGKYLEADGVRKTPPDELIRRLREQLGDELADAIAGRLGLKQPEQIAAPETPEGAIH